MNKLDQILWFFVLLIQGILCVYSFVFSYEENYVELAREHQGVITPKVQDALTTQPLTLSQQQILKDQVASLHNQNAQLVNTKEVISQQFSQLLIRMTFLSLILEAILLWRIIRVSRTKGIKSK